MSFWEFHKRVIRMSKVQQTTRLRDRHMETFLIFRLRERPYEFGDAARLRPLQHDHAMMVEEGIRVRRRMGSNIREIWVTPSLIL